MENAGVLGERTAETEALQDAANAVGLRAMLETVGVSRMLETGWIRVTGEDRVRWLNGMVTNSIQGLATGQGCFTFLLNAQGRIQGTATAFAEGDAVLLETDRGQVEGMLAMLDRFVIMDDVELAEVSGETAGLLVAGPGGEAMLRAAGIWTEGMPADGIAMAEVPWEGEAVRLQRMLGRAVPRFEIWGAAAAIERVEQEVIARGGVAAEAQAVEWLRLVEGTPRFGVDIRERELPQETGQAAEAGPYGALHFSKGCYLGQEIVERIRSRGQVHRMFGGFRLEGAVPERGAALEAGGKPVGELTSVGVLPAMPGFPEGLVLGLGYVRREAVETRQEIGYAGGRAWPVSLPVRAGT